MRALKVFLLVASLVLLGALQSTPAAMEIKTGDRVPGVLIVKFAPDRVPQYEQGLGGRSTMGLTSIDQINGQFRLISFHRLFPDVRPVAPPRTTPDLARFHVLRFPSDVDLDQAANAYRADPTVESVEFDTYAVAEALPNDSLFEAMWNLRQASDHDVDADEAWDQTTGSPAIVLGVTDTGVLYDHPDLRDNIWVNPGEDIDGDGVPFDPDDMNGIDDDGNGYVDDLIGWDFVATTAIPGYPPAWPGEDSSIADNDPKDFHGHGTHTSGTIAAVTNNGHGVSGLAGGFGPGHPGCKIMCLRTGWSIDNYGYESGITTMSYVAEAFVYAANMGARALNYSYGSGTGGGIEAATDYAVAHGVVICASAGNSGSSDPASFGYLQSRSDVICVAATDEYDNRSSFSNYGSLVDISAPGSNIRSTVSNHYTPGYKVANGTSMAAPHVVGVIGLVLSVNPHLTREEIVDILTATADPTSDYIGQMGAGRINASKAVLAAKAMRITHVPLSATADTINAYRVVALIRSDTTLNTDSLSLFYRSGADADTHYVRVTMLQTGNPDEYAADIPAQRARSMIQYGLTAEDFSGDRVSAPKNFPDSAYQFRVFGTPLLASYPDSFGVELVGGHTRTDTLVIRNDGNDDLLFTLGVGHLDTALTSRQVRAALGANAAAPVHAGAPVFPGQTVSGVAAVPQLATEVLARRVRFAANSAPTVRAAVLRSWGSDDAGRADWGYLNANYGEFGSTPIVIDYTTFNHQNITYAELAADDPDVLIISDAWGGYSFRYTATEIEAIRQYVEEGHGLFVTGGTLNSDDAPDHTAALASLLGLDAGADYNWGFCNAGPLSLLKPGHPLFKHMPDPYDATFPVTVCPLGRTWSAATREAEVIAMSPDGRTVVTAFENRVYTSIMPEEVGYYGQSPADDQCVYNAIVYCAGAVCEWLSVYPVAGAVAPHDSAIVDLLTDARLVHQDTTLSCQINLEALDSIHTARPIPVRAHVLPPEHYIEVSPASFVGSGYAGDTTWYADTVTNFGTQADFCRLLPEHAQWASTVWDAGRTAQITETPSLSPSGSYVVWVRIIIPDTASYGSADTLRLVVASDGDSTLAPVIEVVTYSLGHLNSIPWEESFPSLTLDTLRWRQVSGATISDQCINPPSPPYALNLNGCPYWGDTVESGPINLKDQSQVVLSYWYERTGRGSWPRWGQDLIFEVLDQSQSWMEVSRQLGGWPDMTSFEHVEVVLPASAYHAGFRLRIRSIGYGCTYDDWFVDDVSIFAPIPPSVCYRPDSLPFFLNKDDSTTGTLSICNNGPGDLRFRLQMRDPTPPLAGTAFPRVIHQYNPQLDGVPAAGAQPSTPSDAPAVSGQAALGLMEDFEDGTYDGWQESWGAYQREVTSATAAAGTLFSFRQTGGNYSYFDGVSRNFTPGQYAYAGFYVRTSSLYSTGAYVVIGDQNTQNNYGAIFFYASWGRFVVSPGDESFVYEPNRWYHVEFYMHWPSQKFDYYVDGNLIVADLPFRTPTSQLAQVHLFNYTNTTSWWDEIVIGDGPWNYWLSMSPRADTVAPGDTTHVAVKVKSSGLDVGLYRRFVEILSNDPSTPKIDVPVSLRVHGPKIAILTDSVIVDYVEEGSEVVDLIRAANVGDEPLLLNDALCDQPWLSAVGKFIQVVPGDTAHIEVHIAGESLYPGAYRGCVTILSNDSTRGRLDVPVLARVGPDPIITPLPESILVAMAPGDTASRTVTIHNTGPGTLVVSEIEAVLSGGEAVIASSRAIQSTPTPGGPDSVAVGTPVRPDPSTVYAMSLPESGADVSGTASVQPRLEDVKTALNAGFHWITDIIPHRYDFYGGESGTDIYNDGSHMYDFGNEMYANWNGPIPYSNDVIVPGWFFGAGGRYFTRKFPGLFVLAADMQGIDNFMVQGDLGADGFGLVDGAVLQTTIGERTFYGFVKRVYSAYVPSVNHLIIVEAPAAQDFSINTNSDYHRVYGLSGVRRVYYLLYSGSNAWYINNAATVAIMKEFLTTIGVCPLWLDVTPSSALIPPGGQADMSIRLDSKGLRIPDYLGQVVMHCNDPSDTAKAVPVHLHLHAPDIALRPSPLAMYAAEGLSTDSTLWIVNVGDGTLQAAVTADSTWLSCLPGSATVGPGDSVPLTVHVNAAGLIPGDYAGGLTFNSNDYYKPTVITPVHVHVGPDPHIVPVPESLAITLDAGDTATAPMEIRNQGLGTLAFRATAKAAPRPTGAVERHSYPVSYYGPRAQGETDSRVGKPVAQGSGGPDSTGYIWRDSDEPAGPAFQWVDISATGTEVTGLEYGFAGPFPAGFDFPYYDSTYSQFWISKNGFIGFGPTSSYYQGWHDPIPSPYPPNNIIAWFWTYLWYASWIADPTRVYYKNEPDRVIIQFDRYRSCCTSTWITAEVILDRSGTIVIQYRELHGGFSTGNETIGIENRTGTDGLEAAFNTPYVHDSLAIRFEMIPKWLTVVPNEGRVAPGGSGTIGAHVETAELEAPDLYAGIELNSNDPVESTLVVPVHLHLRSPQTAVRPESLFVEATEGLVSDSLLWIINGGDGALHGRLQGDSAWLAAVPESVTIAPQESLAVNVRVNAAAMIPGDYAGTLTVASNDYDRRRLLVPVYVRVGPDPDIHVVPESLSVVLTRGDSAILPVDIQNAGLGTLGFVSNISFAPAPAAAFTPIPAIINPMPSPPPASYSLDSLPPRGTLTRGSASAAIDFPGYPGGIALGPDGRLYVVNQSDDRVWRQNGSGGWETFSATLDWPFSLAFDFKGELAVSDYNRVTIVRPDGNSYPLTSYLPDRIYDLAYAFDGRLFTVQRGGKVLSITPDGTVSILASGLTYYLSGAAFGLDGRLYVSSVSDGRIFAIDRDGNVSTYASVSYAIEGLTFDIAGNLYCGNGYQGYIYRITPDLQVDVIATGYSSSLHLVLDETGLLYIAGKWQSIDTLRVGIPGLMNLRWISVSPRSGRVPAGGSLPLAVGLRSRALPVSDGYAQIVLATNDTDGNPTTVPVHLRIRSPKMTVRPTSISMEAQEGGSTDSTLWVINSGDGELHAAIAADSAWLSPIPDSFVVAAADSLPVTVRVNASGLVPSQYQSALTILSNELDCPKLTVPVNVHVGPDPAIAVWPDSFTVSVPGADSLDTTLVIHNHGMGTLAFRAACTRTGVHSTASRWAEIVDHNHGTADSSQNAVFASPASYGSFGAQNAPTRVAVFEDSDPWGSSRLRDLLYAHGISFDVFGSGSMGVVDLSPYDKVFTLSAQSSSFWGELSDHRAWFETYVRGGGMLETHLASFGGDNLPGLPLPGGFVVAPLVFEDVVSIIDPVHPILTTPNTITGLMLNGWGSSIHGFFGSIPSDAHVVIARTNGGQPVCAEATLGAGSILATTQTVEWYNASLPYLENLVLYEGATAQWLRAWPDSGRVAAGDSALMRVRFVLGRVPAGDYFGAIRFATNDPVNDSLAIPVHLTVPPAVHCVSVCHGDPQCDSVVADVLDVVKVVQVAFRGGTLSAVPSGWGPYAPTDVDCDAMTNVLDVVRFVNVAFRGANPLTEFCHPCGL